MTHLRPFLPTQTPPLKRSLITDVDRTITNSALDVDPRALDRLLALRARGIVVVIASGRPLNDLRTMGLVRAVDAVVAENGAVLLLPPLDSPRLVDAEFAGLAQKALGDDSPKFGWRQVIGSGPRDLAGLVKRRLDAANIPHELSFNAEEVMIMPRGVDKAEGAKRALSALGLRLDLAWAIGDGENDVSLLQAARVSGAPQNAHPAAKAVATVVTPHAFADGFLDFTNLLLDE